VRISAEENHTRHNMIFEKMLVGYATLYKPDALLLDELSDQNMEISNLLVRSGKTMVYDKMDFFRVPNLLNAHLTEDLDSQGSSTVLSHGHVSGQNSNLSPMVDFPASVSLEANDFLSERQRIIVEDRLRQGGREAGRKLSLLKMNLLEL
jgi:hypothetical protein